MTPVRIKPFLGFLLGIPALTLVLLTSCAPARAQVAAAPPPPPASEDKGTIQVTGQAQVSVPADRVRISFTVETEAASAGDATQENARRMESVMAAVRGLNLPGLDVETFGYSLRPEYEVLRENPRTRTISGYRVLNNIRVTVGDVDATGQILDRAVEAGPTGSRASSSKPRTPGEPEWKPFARRWRAPGSRPRSSHPPWGYASGWRWKSRAGQTHPVPGPLGE